MGKFSEVEIPEGSGRFYRYEYVDGQTIYKGPVGDAPAISEEEFNLWVKVIKPTYHPVLHVIVDNFDKEFTEKSYQTEVINQVVERWEDQIFIHFRPTEYDSESWIVTVQEEDDDFIFEVTGRFHPKEKKETVHKYITLPKTTGHRVIAQQLQKFIESESELF